MAWIKRNPSLASIKEVVAHNAGCDINDFLAPKKDYFIKGLDDAVRIIKNAISTGTRVTIVGDYDADGVCASAILKLMFDALNYPVTTRLPRRFTEGYGLSEKIVSEIDDGLLITVDNGIAAIDAIKAAKEKGLTVIVTDHHLPVDGGELPPADVLIDPNAIPNSAEFNGYCGAGIAYKLAKAMLGPEHTLVKKLLSLAAIATVADVMELVEENRLIVKEGLSAMTKYEGRTTGLGALLSLCDMDKFITEKNIGFKVAPMINAAGRMIDDGATKSFELLSFNGKFSIAEAMAKELDDINEERKLEKDIGLAALHDNIERNCLFGEVPLCIYQPGLPEGLVGIFAGQLAEEFQTPCFVFTDSETSDIIKGSARSYGGVNIKNLLDTNADILYKYGGHAEAAGVSIYEKDFDIMKERFMASIDMPEIDENIYYDLEISVSQIKETIQELNKYAPFGNGNPEIVFKIDNFILSPRTNGFYRVMGDKKQHLKLMGNDCSAVGFDLAHKYTELKHPTIVDMVGSLSVNFFMGKFSDQIEMLDFNASSKETPKTAMANLLAKKAQDRHS